MLISKAYVVGIAQPRMTAEQKSVSYGRIYVHMGNTIHFLSGECGVFPLFHVAIEVLTCHNVGSYKMKLYGCV